MIDFKWSAFLQWLRTYGKTIFVTAVVVFFIRWKVVEPFYIPSSSMEPTLKRYDRILVNKIKYAVGTPERWQVLVFKDPHDPSRNFIKRLVGLPGETIRIEDGEIYVNDVRLEKPSQIHSVFYTDVGRWGTVEPVKVPDGCYFMLGDNSERSMDSRMWKDPFVPKADIIGEAVTIIWPFDRIQIIK